MARWLATPWLLAGMIALAGCGGASPSGISGTPTTGTPVTADTATLAASAPRTTTQALPGGAPPPGGVPLPGGAPPGGAGATPVEGSATYAQSGQTVTKSKQTITASEMDQSAVKVTDGGVLTLTDSTVTTSGDTSSMDDASFYGLNAAVLAASGSQITLANSTIRTTGTGANGAFATGDGSTVTLTDVTIECVAPGAHGVDATLAGTVIGNNVDITTAGDGAAAAIATDRGGGTIRFTGGHVKTSGTRSPPIYSTGDITVRGATLSATASEAAVIEGKNSITLTDCALSGAKSWGVLIYQSFSGDAEVGTGTFTMTGGSLASGEGPLFYATNTQAMIKLQGVKLTAPSGTLLSAGANQWGNTGANGATVALTADAEDLNGDIVCDKISAIAAILQNGTTLTGAINRENTGGMVMLTLDESSSWVVSGTSYLASLIDADATLANIHDNGNAIYYDPSAGGNAWLGGKTITLTGGGKLAPRE